MSEQNIEGWTDLGAHGKEIEAAWAELTVNESLSRKLLRRAIAAFLRAWEPWGQYTHPEDRLIIDRFAKWTADELDGGGT